MAKNADGVEIPDGNTVIGTQNDERLAFMQRINDQLDAGERGKELADVNDDDTVSTFNPTELNDPVIAKEESQPEEQDFSQPDIANVIGEEEIVAAPVKTPQKYKIKVNGVEKEVALEDLIATAQKVESADEYLRRAKEAAQQDSKPKAPPAPSIEDVRKAQVEEAKRIAQAIQMGNEEEAIQAVLALRNTGPSTDDLIRTVDERLTFQQALEQFKRDYKEIAADPLLNKLAMERDNELIRAGDTRPYHERYHDIGEQIRGWVNAVAKNANAGQTPAQQAPVPQVAATPAIPLKAAKQALKAAVEQPPRGTAGKPLPPEEEPEETPSQVIQKMAQARGGPQWMTGVRGLNS